MSSSRQIDGDSLRRQLEASELYAEANGLELDTTLRDLGVSAFDGSNVQYGALGVFLEKARNGEIAKNSFLLVESLDRLSRDYVDEAYDLFRAILKADIIIVTLVDGQEYSRESIRKNWVQIIISLAIMSRAHEESAIKSKRLRELWIEKRKLIHMEKLTARAPHWLILSKDRKQFLPDPKRVPVVQRIFREYVDGIGQGTIAKRLNKDGVPSFGKGRKKEKSDGWHGGTVSKIIPNRAVTGWYQPHRLEIVEENGVRTKVRVPVGEPIPDYFPRIIDEDLWLKAQHIGATRLSQFRGTGWKPNARGPKGVYYSNIFTGFSRCAKCGAAYVIKPAGARQVSVLRCSKERRGMCDNTHREKYDRMERAVVEFLGFYETEEQSPEIADLRRQIAEHLSRKADLERRIENLKDKIEEGEPVGDRVAVRQAELDTAILTIQDLQKRLGGLQVMAPSDERLETFKSFYECMQTVSESERYAFRAKVAQAIREVVERLVFHPDGWVELLCHGDRTAVTRFHFMFREGVFEEVRLVGPTGEIEGVHKVDEEEVRSGFMRLKWKK
jgi:DNA invertase Pin-like site-specific DNA recombinase